MKKHKLKANDNVDKKLIVPLIKYNNKLIMQNDKLLIELSKVKNARKYYYDLEQKFIELKKESDEMDKKLKYNKIEMEACYNIIKDFTEKNERMEKILKEKLGIGYNSLYKSKF